MSRRGGISSPKLQCQKLKTVNSQIQAAELLPEEPWDDSMWSTWTKAIKTETGAKGRALFHPLRLALTGRDNGPELKPLMAIMGRDRVLARLKGETA